MVCLICGNNIKKNQKRYKVHNWVYYYCKKCISLSLYPQPNTFELKSYYQEQFSYNLSKLTEERIIKKSEEIISNITKRTKGKRMLDIGSGNGYLAQTAIKSGYMYFGVEPSKELFKKLVSKNLKVNCTSIENFLSRNKDKFDVITLIHVIEHIGNPRDLLLNLYKILNPNGVIYVETPNLDSYLFSVEKENYTFLTPPDHLFIFSEKSLVKMLTGKKYTLNSCTYSYNEHIIGIIRKIYIRIFKNRVTGSPSKIYPPIENQPTKEGLLEKIPLFPISLMMDINKHGAVLCSYISKP